MFDTKIPVCDICGEEILLHHWTVIKNGKEAHGICSVDEQDYAGFEFFPDMGGE